MDISPLISNVLQPLFDSVGLGAVIAGLMIWVIGWAIFSMVTGRKE